MNQEEWDKIEKEFLAQLQTYFFEINSSIQNLRTNKDNPLIRSQLCLALIGADTFSRFKLIFDGMREGLDFDNEKRFKGWLNTFVFTEENEVYLKNKEKIKCDAGIVWQLRNSLLHFYSFPESKNEQHIGFVFNFSESLRNKFENGFKKVGQKVTLIDAYYLIEIILHGFLLQLRKLAEMIKNFPKQYIDAVLFAHKIVMQEGASTIDLKREKNQENK